MDTCETAGTPTEISITLTPDGFTVTDNGPGLPTALIEGSLDYNIRVSDKTYYVSPSRGQLGNALKCLWAAPYAVAPDTPGAVEVQSLGVQHFIRVRVDHIAQEPRLEHILTESPSKLKARTFRVTFHLSSIGQTKTKAPKPVRLHRNPVALAQEWQAMLTSGRCSSPAALARQLGLSRARITQVLNLLKLTPKLLDVITDLGDPLPSPLLSERRLRSLANLTVEEQCRRMDMILANKR